MCPLKCHVSKYPVDKVYYTKNILRIATLFRKLGQKNIFFILELREIWPTKSYFGKISCVPTFSYHTIKSIFIIKFHFPLNTDI
jgi:hypothetical protein